MRTVIKLGGSVLLDAALRQQLIAQVAELKGAGFELILVHGGGKQIAALLDRLGVQSRFHDGLRVTDKAARDVAQMVLAGQVGKDLVAEFAKVGVAAAGLAGGDGLSFLAEKMNAEDGTDLGYVGRIVKTNEGLMAAMLDAGVTPVVACLRSAFQISNITTSTGIRWRRRSPPDAMPRAWYSSRTSAASATSMASESPNLTGSELTIF